MSAKDQQGKNIDAAKYTTSTPTTPFSSRVSQKDTSVISMSINFHVLVLITASPYTHATHNALSDEHIFLLRLHTYCVPRMMQTNVKLLRAYVYYIDINGPKHSVPPSWNITLIIFAKTSFKKQRSLPRIQVIICWRPIGIMHWGNPSHIVRSNIGWTVKFPSRFTYNKFWYASKLRRKCVSLYYLMQYCVMPHT